MAVSIKPRIGLKDVVYAVFDEGTSTYGTITSLTGAMELSFDPASSAATLFADDGAFATAETVGEMSISFGLADILPVHEAALLGHSYANGVIEYGVNDQSPYVAIGAKMLRAGKDGSNEVYSYMWLPKVKLSKPSSSAMTKGASIEFQTPTMEGRVVQNSSGVYKTSIRTDDTNVSATLISNWFSSVVESTGASTTAVTLTSAVGDDAANTITLTFDKSSESFSLKTVPVGGITVSVVSTGLLIAGTTTYTYSAAGAAPTITLTNANISAVQYLVTVNSTVQDNNNVGVTAESILCTPA